MADDEQPPQEDEKPKKKSFVSTLLVVVATAVVFGGTGAAVPLVLMRPATTEQERQPIAVEMSPPAFVPFGETVVNLDDGRLSRYLRVGITLQIKAEDQAEIEKQVQINKAILKSWLLSHLSDKSMEDIRGAAGQNRLRREIQDYFNTTLFPDGIDRIHDILFEEFNVQ